MDFRGALVTLNKQGLLPKFSEQIIGLGELVEAAEDLVNSQHEDFHAAPNA